MRERKRAELERLAGEYRALLAFWSGAGASDSRIAQDLNNAYLASVAAYEECVPGFERLLAEVGNDLPLFYQRVKLLAREEQAARHQEVCTVPQATPRPVKN